MTHRARKWMLMSVAMAAICLGAGAWARGEPASSQGPPCTDAACVELARLTDREARTQVAALARLLALNPDLAIDFSATTGETCLNAGGQVMTHFAIDPAKAKEDIIYFIDSAPLVARGLRLDEFPALGKEIGSMRPNTWYRYDGTGTEPHHGRAMPDRKWLMLAAEVK